MGTTTLAIEPELLTDAEAAHLCGMGRSTWRRLHAAGKVPEPVRLGGCVRWRRREILDWIEEGCPPRDRWRWGEDAA